MRQFKFRAWDKGEGAMHEVAWLRFEDGKNLSNVGSYWNDGQHNGASRLDPDQVVVMQYTGLKDENGVEIYEGDIVKYSNYGTGNSEEVRAVSFNVYDGFFGPSWCDLSDGDVFVEVIGNVYQNSELLETAA